MNLQIQDKELDISNQFMNKGNFPAHYVIIKQQLSHLTTHKKSVHQGFKYPFTICGFKASFNSDLNKHIRKHKEKKYHCKSCDKEYVNAASLRKQNKSVHEGVTYNCNVCQSTFTEKGSLSTHIKSVHFKESYQCKICDYQATQKGSLSTHMSKMFIKRLKILIVVNVTNLFKRGV